MSNINQTIIYELSKLNIGFRTGDEEERKEYIALYKRTLNAMWLPALNSKEEARLKKLEEELEYEQLAKFRLSSIAEVRLSIKKQKGKGGGGSVGHFVCPHLFFCLPSTCSSFSLYVVSLILKVCLPSSF